MNLLTSTDLAFQLNDGKFEYNKRCGYVALLFLLTVHEVLLSYIIMYNISKFYILLVITSFLTVIFVPEFKISSREHCSFVSPLYTSTFQLPCHYCIVAIHVFQSLLWKVRALIAMSRCAS